MENNFNKPGQFGADQTKTMEKDRGFQRLKSDLDETKHNVEEGVKGVVSELQHKMEEGKEKASEFMSAVDKQVRDNPWPVIAGVAVGSFLLASLISKSRK